MNINPKIVEARIVSNTIKEVLERTSEDRKEKTTLDSLVDHLVKKRFENKQK